MHLCSSLLYGKHDKKFTAQAVFDIQEQGGSSGFNISKDLGALASLTGLFLGQIHPI